MAELLQRIIAIKNVGRFKRCSAIGDVTFRHLSLIFAENGRGKTTLCSILRSQATDTPALVKGRTTLGASAQPEIQLLFSTGNSTFRGNAWAGSYPNVAVFDSVYIADNVFAGDVVDTDHRRNLYRVIIGAEGVTLAALVTDFDRQIRGKNDEIRSARSKLGQFAAGVMPVDQFIALANDPDIDAKITAKERELQAVQHSARLQQRPILDPISIPQFPSRFPELLAKTIAHVGVDAETRVVAHLSRHEMQDKGEEWIGEGLRYVADESCPFCGQGVDGITLLRAYRDFFSDEYRALRDEINELISQIDSTLSDVVAVAIEHTAHQNRSNAEFWLQYCELVVPGHSEAGEMAVILTTLRQEAQSLLKAKLASPIDSVPPGPGFTQALTIFEGVRASLAAYNAEVSAANAVIAVRKREAQAANASEVERALALLKAQKIRYVADVSAICASEASLQLEKTKMDGEKMTAKDRLDAHTQQLIAKYGQSINRHLELINAGFRISQPTHSYRGGQPSTSYQIIINQETVELGDAATPLDKPSFANTLSSGDRSTLALAFFLAQVQSSDDIATKIVVFDDPFTSLDRFRRSQTAYQILKVSEKSAQVIVLSHEPSFLKLLWDEVDAAQRKSFQLSRVGEDNTLITEWDIEKSVQARDRTDAETMQKFLSLGEGDPRDVIQKIRPLLEAYCRRLQPSEFGDRDTLGVIIGKITKAGDAHQLFGIVDSLDELNMYGRRYHHAENPNAATEPIDDTELQGYVKRTLMLVGWFP